MDTLTLHTEKRTLEDYQKILDDMNNGISALPDNLLREIRIVNESKVTADSYFNYVNVLNQQVKVSNTNHVG